MLALIVWVCAGSVAAQDAMHASPHTDESEILIGVKGVGIAEWIDREIGDRMRYGGAVGAHVEWSVVPSWLEIEIGAVAAYAEGETFVTLEPLAKKNLHLDEHVDLYLGVGPVIGVAIAQEGTLFAIGGVAVIGAYLWIVGWLGIDLEICGQVAFVGEPAVELSIGAGPVLRL